MKRGPLPIWSGCGVCPRLLHVSQQVPLALAIRHGHGLGMDMEEEGHHVFDSFYKILGFGFLKYFILSPMWFPPQLGS